MTGLGRDAWVRVLTLQLTHQVTLGLRSLLCTVRALDQLAGPTRRWPGAPRARWGLGTEDTASFRQPLLGFSPRAGLGCTEAPQSSPFAREAGKQDC